jgi:hypothetical protein
MTIDDINTYKFVCFGLVYFVNGVHREADPCVKLLRE